MVHRRMRAVPSRSLNWALRCLLALQLLRHVTASEGTQWYESCVVAADVLPAVQPPNSSSPAVNATVLAAANAQQNLLSAWSSTPQVVCTQLCSRLGYPLCAVSPVGACQCLQRAQLVNVTRRSVENCTAKCSGLPCGGLGLLSIYSTRQPTMDLVTVSWVDPIVTMESVRFDISVMLAENYTFGIAVSGPVPDRPEVPVVCELLFGNVSMTTVGRDRGSSVECVLNFNFTSESVYNITAIARTPWTVTYSSQQQLWVYRPRPIGLEVQLVGIGGAPLSSASQPSCLHRNESAVVHNLEAVKLYTNSSADFTANVYVGKKLFFTWYFPDDKATAVNSPNSACSGAGCRIARQSHVFRRAGIFTVLVSASNDLGTANHSITVVVLDRSVQNLTVLLSSPSVAVPGSVAHFTVFIQTAAFGETVLRVDFGDGSNSITFAVADTDLAGPVATAPTSLLGANRTSVLLLNGSYGDVCFLTAELWHVYGSVGVFEPSFEAYNNVSHSAMSARLQPSPRLTIARLPASVAVNLWPPLVTYATGDTMEAEVLSDGDYAGPSVCSRGTAWSLTRSAAAAAAIAAMPELNVTVVSRDDWVLLQLPMAAGTYRLAVQCLCEAGIVEAEVLLIVEERLGNLTVTRGVGGSRSDRLSIGDMLEVSAQLSAGTGVNFTWLVEPMPTVSGAVRSNVGMQAALLSAASTSGAVRVEQYAANRSTEAYLTFLSQGEFAVSVVASNALGNVTTSAGIVIVERLLPWLAVSGCQAIIAGQACSFTVHVMQRAAAAASASARSLAIDLQLVVDGKSFARTLIDDGRELEFNYTFAKAGWYELNVTASNDVSSVHGRTSVLVQEPLGSLRIVEAVGTRGSGCGGWTLLAMVNASEGLITWRRDALYQWTVVATEPLDGSSLPRTIAGTGPLLCLNQTTDGYLVNLLVQNQADRLTAELNITDSTDDGSSVAFVLQHSSRVEVSQQLNVSVVQHAELSPADCSSGWLADVDYGDGTTEGFMSPSVSYLTNHTYATAGLYRLLLNVSCLRSPDVHLVSSSYVIVSAHVVAPTINGPRLVALNPLGTETVWTVGAVADPTLVFTWNFGDGKNENEVVGSEVLHRFTEPGVYNVTVTSRNSDGEVTASDQVVVAYPTVEATAVVPAVPVGRTSNLTVEWWGCNADSVGDVLVVDFGDGSPQVNVSGHSGVLVSPTNSDLHAGFPRCRAVLRHRYNSTGVYLVTVTVSSPVSAVQCYTVTYVDEPIAGIAVAASAYVVAAGDIVSFEARATSGRQLQFAWNFGTGNLSDIGAEILPRQDQELQCVARFRYDIPGTYYVAVTVVSEAYQDQSITVRLERPVKVLKQVQQLSLSVNQTYLNVSASAWFTVEWTPAVSPVILVFKYDDGSANDNMTVYCTTNASKCAVVVSHTYTAAGSYRPSVTALSSLGRRRDLTAYLGGGVGGAGGVRNNNNNSSTPLPALVVQVPVGRVAWTVQPDSAFNEQYKDVTRFYTTLGSALSMAFTVGGGTDLLVDWTYGDGSYDLSVANTSVLKWYTSTPSVSNAVPREPNASAGPWFNASVRVYNKVSFVEAKARVYILSNFTSVQLMVNDQVLSPTSLNVFDVTKPVVLSVRVYPSWMVYTSCSYRSSYLPPNHFSLGEFSRKDWPPNAVPVESVNISVRCAFNKPQIAVIPAPLSDYYLLSLRGHLGSLSIGTQGKTTFVVNTTIVLSVSLTANLPGTVFSWLVDGSWSNPSTEQTFSCMFPRRGTYTISLSANNTVDYAIANTTLLVLAHPCSIDELKIRSPWASALSIDAAASFTPSDSIQLEAGLTISCGSFDSWAAASVRWLILNSNDSPVNGSFPQSWLLRRSLVLPPGALPYGTYSADVVVEVADTTVRRSADRRLIFSVVPSDLVPIIDGGLARTMSVGRLVALNASRSYDPDCFTACPKLSFRWYCSVSGKVIGSCFDSNDQANVSLMFLNTTNVFQKANSKLVDFTVVVCRSGTSQCANTSQTWDFSKPGKLDVIVDCPQCHAYGIGSTFDATSPARLRVTCESCPPDSRKATYTWRSDRIEGSVAVDGTSSTCLQPPDRFAALMSQLVAPTAADAAATTTAPSPSLTPYSVTVPNGARTTASSDPGTAVAAATPSLANSTAPGGRTTVATAASTSSSAAGSRTTTPTASAITTKATANVVTASLNVANTAATAARRGDGSVTGDSSNTTSVSQRSYTQPAASSLGVDGSGDYHSFSSAIATIPSAAAAATSSATVLTTSAAASITSAPALTTSATASTRSTAASITSAPASTTSTIASTVSADSSAATAVWTISATSASVASSAGVKDDSIELVTTAKVTAESSSSWLVTAITHLTSTAPSYGADLTSASYLLLTSEPQVGSDTVSIAAAGQTHVSSPVSPETTSVPHASSATLSALASTAATSAVSGAAAADNVASSSSEGASASANVLSMSATVSTTAVAASDGPSTVATTRLDDIVSRSASPAASVSAASSTASTTHVSTLLTPASTYAPPASAVSTVRLPPTTKKKIVEAPVGRRRRSAPGDAVESEGGRLPVGATPATVLPTTTEPCQGLDCARADGLPVYALNIYEMKSAPVSLNSNTSSRGDELLVLSGQLLDGGQYRLSATIDLGSGLLGTSVYYIRANYGPKSGACGLESKGSGLRATEGIEMQSPFVLNCYSWRDEASAGFIAYEVRFSYAPDTSARYILYRGFDPTVRVFLPAGSAEHNNTVLVQLLVYNARGSATTACSRGYNVYPRIFTLNDICNELFNFTTPMNSLIANTQDDALRRSFLLFVAQKLFNIVEQNCAGNVASAACNFTAVNAARLHLLDSVANETIRNRLEAEQTLAVLKWALALRSDSQMNVEKIRRIVAVLCHAGLALVDSNRYRMAVRADTFDDAISCISFLIGELNSLSSAASTCPDCPDVYRSLENAIDVFLTAQQLHKLTVDLPSSYTSSILHVWARRLDLTSASISSIGCFFFNVSLSPFTSAPSASRSRRSDGTGDVAIATPCAELRIVALSGGAGMLPGTTSAVTVKWQACYDYGDLPRPLLESVPSFSGETRDFNVTLSNYVEVNPINYTLSKHNMNIHSFTVSSLDLMRDLTIVINLEVTADYRYPVVLYESREKPPDPSLMQASGTPRKLAQGQTALYWGAGELSPGVYYLALADAGLDARRPVPGEVTEQSYSILAWWSACLSRANATAVRNRNMWPAPATISSAYTAATAGAASSSSPADDPGQPVSDAGWQWTSGSCRLVRSPLLESVRCACKASSVSVTADVSPLFINVTITPLAQFFPVKWRPFVAIVVAVAMAIYVLVLIACFAIDRRRPPQEKLVPLHDNSVADKQKYIITLETGNLPSAGTTAKVSIVLHGKHGLSETRELLGGVGSVSGHVALSAAFRRNSRVTFLLTLPQGIGQLWKVQLWHDNSGSSPNWYLKRITIRDVNAAESYFAICEKWFAVEEDDGKVEREFMLSLSREQKLSFFTVLHVKIPQYMADYHMWASLVHRPTYSRYGRAERCAVCALAVAEYMALAAAYLSIYVTEYRGEMKLFDLAPDALLVGLVLPFVSYLSLLLVALVFRKSSWLRYRLPACLRRLRRARGSNVTGSKADLSGLDNDGYEESYEDADEALEQSIQKWQSLQEWAQKQWEKRYQYSFPLPTDADKPEADDQLDGGEQLDTMRMPPPALVVYALTAAATAPDGSSAPPPYTSGFGSAADSLSHCSSADGGDSSISSSGQRMLPRGRKEHLLPHAPEAFLSRSGEPSTAVAVVCSNEACPYSGSRHGHFTKDWQTSGSGPAAAVASSPSIAASAAAVLPAWCRLVAWLACIGGFVACLCITVYCSRQFQGWRIVMWVQSVCIAMLVCAFVTQPLGVLLAALRTAFAVLFDRIPTSALLHFTDRYVDDVEQLHLASGFPAASTSNVFTLPMAGVKRPHQLPLYPAEDELQQAVAARQRSRHLRLARPPQERQLIEARKQRIKEKKLWQLLRDTVWLALAFALLLLLAFVDDVRPAYMLNRNVMGLFSATSGPSVTADRQIAGFFWRDSRSAVKSNLSAVAFAGTAVPLPDGGAMPLALWRSCCRTEVEGSVRWLPCACVNGSAEAAARPVCTSAASAEASCFRQPFSSVRSFDEFWRWAQTELVETLYGGRLASRLGGTVVVGGIVRLRQVRVHPQPCTGPLPPAATDSRAPAGCYPPLSGDSLSTEPFVAGNVTYSYEDPSTFGISPGRLLGRLAQYGLGGHVASLPIQSDVSAETTRIALAKLEAVGWLDDATRAVIVETTLYNPAAALFAPLTLLCEVDAGSGGLLLPSVAVSAVRLSRYSGGGSWFLLACELLFFAMLLAQARATLAAAGRLRLRFLRDPWSMAELAFVLVAAAYALATVHRAVVVQQVVDRYAVTYHRQFVSMANIGDCDHVANCLLGIMLFLCSCRLLHLLRYSATFARLGDVLRRSRAHLAAMVVLYVVMVLAWSSLGVGLFYGTSSHFTQYASGFTTVASIASHNVHDSGMWNGYGLGAFTVCTVAVGHYLIRCLAVAIPFHYYRNPRRNEVLSMTFGEGVAFVWKQLREAVVGGCGSKPKAPPEELCADQSKLLPPEFALAEMECQVDELLSKMKLLSPVSGSKGVETWPKCAPSLSASGRSASSDDDQAAGTASPDDFSSRVTTAATKHDCRNVAAPLLSGDRGEKLRSQLERAVWRGCDSADGGALPPFDCDPFDQQPPDIPFYGEDDPGDPACTVTTHQEDDFGFDHVNVWGDDGNDDAASGNDGSSLLISIPDESPQQERSGSRPPPAVTSRTLPRGSGCQPPAKHGNCVSRYHHQRHHQELVGGKRTRDERSSIDRPTVSRTSSGPEKASGGGRLRRRTSGGLHDAVELDVMVGGGSDAQQPSPMPPSSSNFEKRSGRSDCPAVAVSSCVVAECQVYVNKAFETADVDAAAEVEGRAARDSPSVHAVGAAEKPIVGGTAKASAAACGHENEAFVRDDVC